VGWLHWVVSRGTFQPQHLSDSVLGGGTISPSITEHNSTMLDAWSSLTRSGPAASVISGITGSGTDSNKDDNKTGPFQ